MNNNLSTVSERNEAYDWWGALTTEERASLANKYFREVGAQELKNNFNIALVCYKNTQLNKAYVFQHKASGLQMFVYHKKSKVEARIYLSYVVQDVDDWVYLGMKTATDVAE